MYVEYHVKAEEGQATLCDSKSVKLCVKGRTGHSELAASDKGTACTLGRDLSVESGALGRSGLRVSAISYGAWLTVSATGSATWPELGSSMPP